MESLIELLLGNKYLDEFFKISELYYKERYEKLFNDYKERLDLEDIFDNLEEFIDSIEEEEIGLETLLLWFANSKNLVLWLDWNGEEKEGQVADFIEEVILNKFKIKLDIENKYEEIATLDERNEFIAKLQALNKVLKSKGFILINIDNDGDEYFLTVIRNSVDLSLVNNKINFIEISDVDELSE